MRKSAPSVLFFSCIVFSGCKEDYRVGEYVAVEWCDGIYPAFVTAKRNRTRFRVHLEGYESRWDTDVNYEQIRGRLEAPPSPSPPLCDRVARALGIKKLQTSKGGKSGSGKASQYKVGAKVKVSWRGSTYRATILEVVDSTRVKVHYDGHESAWDEVVPSDRIVTGRR